MTRRYRLPAHLGGLDYPGEPSAAPSAIVLNIDGHDAVLPLALLTVVKPDMPPEPPIGAVLRDNEGVVWQHDPEGWFAHDAECHSWAELRDYWPLTRLVTVPDLAELLDTMRAALDEECREPGEWCTPWHDKARALLAKHAAVIS